MARTRLLKPAFFKNEDLARLPFEWRLLFAGLWGQADRAGRMEDRPTRLKAEIFPYDDVNIRDGLAKLADAGFITRYTVTGHAYIAITTFLKHQTPHHREPPSDLPKPPDSGTKTESPGLAQGKPRSSPPLTLNPLPLTGTSTRVRTSSRTSHPSRVRFPSKGSGNGSGHGTTRLDAQRTQGVDHAKKTELMKRYLAQGMTRAQASKRAGFQ